MPGQGCGLVGNTFHQVAIADEGIGKVVHERMFRSVKARSQKTFRQGEPNGVRGPLPKGACGCFDARGISVFRVPWGHRPPLPEIL